MTSDHLLFVYGSLMRGFQYNALLSDADFVARTRTDSCWTLLDLGRYPGVIPGVQRIEGELYRLPDSMLARLDRLEGCPELYQRAKTGLEDG
ncbi:MAG: gamma-glutamylcyclotransferase family protein, partial [Myxococcota bacterium]|nr:gamma-glutamylcyclotransferase family protein [Myxococcota bacterium]